MLLSNLTSHPSLLPLIAHLTIPIIPLPKSEHYPPYFFPAAASASSTIHPDFRDPVFDNTNSEERQAGERETDGLRALVQAFEDGASDGVKEGKGKRKGECHFLSSVFANVSMVSLPLFSLQILTVGQVPATRPLLLTPRPPFHQPASSLPNETDEPLLAKIVVFTEHPDTIRRGGALGCIKNCAMDRGSMGWLLASESETGLSNPRHSAEALAPLAERVRLPSDPTRKVKGVDVLPWVLGPLMGPEEYDIEVYLAHGRIYVQTDDVSRKWSSYPGCCSFSHRQSNGRRTPCCGRCVWRFFSFFQPVGLFLCRSSFRPLDPRMHISQFHNELMVLQLSLDVRHYGDGAPTSLFASCTRLRPISRWL